MKQQKRKKRLIIGGVIAALILAGGLYVFATRLFGQSSTPQTTTQNDPVRKVNDVDYSPPSQQDQKLQDQQKDQIVQPPSNPNPSPSAISVSISRASQAGPGEPLVVRAIVAGTSSGTCTLTLTRSGQPTITKTFPITFAATYSTCDGSQVNAADFAVDGDWQLQVTAQSGTTTSAPATVTVSVRKQ